MYNSFEEFFAFNNEYFIGSNYKSHDKNKKLISDFLHGTIPIDSCFNFEYARLPPCHIIEMFTFSNIKHYFDDLDSNYFLFYDKVCYSVNKECKIVPNLKKCGLHLIRPFVKY